MDEKEYGKMLAEVAGKCKVLQVSHLQPACYVEIEYKGELGEVKAIGFSKCQYPDVYEEKNGRDVAFVKAVGHAVGLLLIKRVNELEADRDEIVKMVGRKLEKAKRREKRKAETECLHDGLIDSIWPQLRACCPSYTPHTPKPKGRPVGITQPPGLLDSGLLELSASTRGGQRWLSREAPQFGRVVQEGNDLGSRLPCWQTLLIVNKGLYNVDEVKAYLLQYSENEQAGEGKRIPISSVLAHPLP